MKPIQILINAKDNASAVFSGLQGKVAAVGAAIATYFGINAFAGIVRGAADLEQGMSRVQAATGATAEEMQALRKAAEDAGANTKFTSTEAASALENLAKAGLTAGEAIEALPAVLQLAQAGDIGLAESSEMVTKAVMGMGLAFSDAGRVADVLALGANATNTSVTGLAQALSYAAPVAQSLGLSLESTVAIVGKFADAGIDASRAGTALNSILSQFSNPASKFRAELNAAGITTSNFEDALHQLAAAGPAGSKAINAVGQEAGPALRALLNQGMGALDDLTSRLRNAEGSAAATAATMQNNLNGAFNGLASAWDTVKNALGTPVLPVLQQGVEQLAGAFRAAVADGTVGKFGEAIATAFQAGIKWVREFLATVDFSAVLARLQAFATSANETFTKVGEYASNAGNIVKTAYGVMTAGTNAVLTAIYGIGSVFSEVAATVLKGVAMLREGLATVTFGELSASFKLAAEDARSMAQGFGDAAQAMRDKASQSFQDMAAAAQTARDGFTGLVGGTAAATAATDTWAASVARAAAEIEAAGKAQAEANTKVAAAKKAADDQAAAAAAAAQAIATLRAEYQTLVASGSLQAAAEKLEEINGKLRETPDTAQKAVEAIEGAFRNLGMQTTQDLEEAAAKTSAAWDTLTSQGVKSAAVMRDAEDATHRVGKAAGGAAGGYRDMAGAAAAAAANVKALEKIYDKHRLDDGKDKYKVGDGKDLVGKSRDIRYAAVNDTDINQQIAARYGEEAVGNDLAEKAWQLRLQLQAYQKNYGNARSAQSLLEQRNIAAELDRVERLLNDVLNGDKPGARTTGMGGGTAPGAGGVGGSAGGGGAGRGGGGGVSRGGPPSGMATSPTQITINLEGRPRTLNTDAAGAQVLQDLLRELGTSRGTYQ